MAQPGRTGEKTSVGLVAKTGLLSAPKAAPASGRLSAQWVDPMRAVSLDYSGADGDDGHADALSSSSSSTVAYPRPADATHPSSAASRLRAAWQAMPELVRVMFALDLVMGMLYFLSRRAKDLIPKPLLNFFDLNGETNLPSWFSAGQLALIGVLIVAFAAAHLRRGARAAWSLVIAGTGFLFLSLDEVTSLHENVGYWLDRFQHRRGTALHETGYWMVICAPVFLAFIVLLGLGARRYLRGRTRVVVKFAVGVAIFLAAAAGVEALSNFVAPHGAGARALVLLEEMGEMLGATTMLWGVCELIHSHGVRMFLVRDGAPAEA